MKILVLMVVIVVAALLYPLRNGGTICDATKDELAQQAPFAVEILAARHPLAVGLARSWLNDNGAVDKLAQDYIRYAMYNQQSVSPVACYVAYYAVMFEKDKVRVAEADWLEKQLDLN